jgi:F1F0 ATPase subunit 2
MGDTSTLVVAAFAGVLLGAIFFGGLLWTIRKCLSSAWPAALFLCSLLVRMTVTVAGFYFVSHGDWRKVVACLLGFLVARFLVTRFTRTSPEREARRVEGDAA